VQLTARAFGRFRRGLLLMGHENRQFRMRKNMAGCAAKDHLAKSALGVGTLDEKIGMEFRRIFEDGFACGAGLHAARDKLNWRAISLQAAGQILALRTIHTPASYRQEDHPLGL
jgi:hypothetical protein